MYKELKHNGVKNTTLREIVGKEGDRIREVVVEKFMELLVLNSKGKVDMVQEGAFGDIQVIIH